MVLRDLDLEQGLRELGLHRMAAIVKERLRACQAARWSYKRLLRELIEEERAFRQQGALNRRINKSNIPKGWNLETFPFHLQPGVDRGLINELAELEFIRTGKNICFIAKTGRGKTGLASSLLLKALLAGYTGMCQTVQNLLDDLLRSVADRRTKHLLNRLCRMDVIVADEMGYLTLSQEQANLLFRLIETRYLAGKATIITTNLGYDEWGQFLTHLALKDALLSRLRQRCETITIEGPDLRTLV